MLEIQILAWDMPNNEVGLNWLIGSHPSTLDNWISVGLNWLIGSHPSPLDNWISKGNTYINKQ